MAAPTSRSGGFSQAIAGVAGVATARRGGGLGVGGSGASRRQGGENYTMPCQVSQWRREAVVEEEARCGRSEELLTAEASSLATVTCNSQC